MGRFREELARGHSRFQAVGIAITNVGEAVTASAVTTISGLCMMAFADFAIFRATGPSLGIGLAVGLLASLTFAPALMAVLGRHLFWPVKVRVIEVEKTRSGRFWDRFARIVIRHPGLILVLVTLAFVPLATLGGVVKPSYNLFKELPADAPSVKGNDLLVARFAETSRSEQLTLVVKAGVNFRAHGGMRTVDKLCDAFLATGAEVTEVRSATRPMGKIEPHIRDYLTEDDNPFTRFKLEFAGLGAAFERYVSKDGHVMRISILLKSDTFSPKAMRMANQLRPLVRSVLKEAGVNDAEIHFGGVSPHMYDLSKITRSDLRRLRWMVLGVLYIILAVVLRGGIAPLYLLATMVLNYFTTLGILQLFFVNFLGWEGLDWKVEFFLFVLLVAIGVDHNIYIMSRVREESRRQPFRQALHHSIVFTGSIISSCGVIMAGTFGSMARSTLSVVQEIGLGMAVGVLLDTFIVRPMVVPACALLVEWVKGKLRRGKTVP
jgi:RND superfamily putative drug exporter